MCSEMNFENGREENCTTDARSDLYPVVGVGSVIHKLRGGRMMLSKKVAVFPVFVRRRGVMRRYETGG